MGIWFLMEKKLETEVNKVQIVKEKNLIPQDHWYTIVVVNVDVPSDTG